MVKTGELKELRKELIELKKFMQKTGKKFLVVIIDALIKIIDALLEVDFMAKYASFNVPY